MDLRRHLVLVGLMGSGKTTVGRRIARQLGVPFADNDAALETVVGTTAAVLAASEGIERLHEAEADVLLAHLSEPRPMVVAAAAATIEDPACRAALDGTFVAWLDADLEVLAGRASTGGHRPLGADEVQAQLTAQADRRRSSYAAAADVIVDVGASDPEAAASSIVGALGSWSGSSPRRWSRRTRGRRARRSG